jgi:hypothetical protein
MKLKDHIKRHHNGTQSHFAAFHGIPAPRVNELLKSDREHVVLTYTNEEGERVTSIFKECRKLEGKR